MNTNKIKAVLLGVLFLAGGFFSSFAKNNFTQYVIKTKYFDIIYQLPSEKCAKLISERIDDIYLDIRKSFGAEKYYYFKHFPVYIKHTTDDLNAYYTDTPFSNIVLFDTVPRENLAVFEENILSVLQHELVHAVSFNLKNKFNKALSDIIFDGWGNLFWTGPKSLTEGIAVQKESENGLGRLNDGFSTHIIRQSKIENCFPEYQEVTGSRDIYPIGNVPYIFGGAFVDFVNKKYGKEKFLQFADYLNNKLLNYTYLYKTVFGSSLISDWEEFEKSISVPDVKVSPYDEEGVSDFYTLLSEESENRNLTQKKLSRPGGITSFITEAESGTAWYFNESGDVWISKKSNSDGSEKTSKLFTVSGISKIEFSSDGRFLTVSRTRAKSTYKNSVLVYDVKNRKFINFNKDGYRDGIVFFDGNNYFFAAVNTLSQSCTMEIYSFSPSGVNHFSLVRKIEFPFGELVMNLSDAGNGEISYLLKSGLKWSISLYNNELDSVENFPVPEGMNIRYLSGIAFNNFVTGQKGKILSFSYCEKKSLPRLGFLSVKYNEKNISAKYHLMTKDISGGVYMPSVYFSSESIRLPSMVFISQFFDNSKLSVINTDYFEFKEVPAVVHSVEGLSLQKSDEGEKPLHNQLALYNPFAYITRGIFVPLSLVPMYNHDFDVNDIAFLGISWASKNYLFTAGYEPFTNCGGLSAVFFGNTETQNMSYLAKGRAIFDQKGFRQTEEELELKAVFPVLNHSNVILQSVTKYFYGKPNYFPLIAEGSSSDRVFQILTSTTGISFSTVRKTGAGIHEKGGFFIEAFANYTFFEDCDAANRGKGVNIGFSSGFSVPMLLPFENPKGLTCNLPFKAGVTVFPDISKFVQVDGKMVLFSAEIQKGTSNFIIPLYLNRLYVTALYSGSLYYGAKQNLALFNWNELQNGLNGSVYADSAGIGFVMGFKVNTGTLFATMDTIDLSVDLLFDINQKTPGTNRVHLKIYSQLVF